MKKFNPFGINYEIDLSDDQTIQIEEITFFYTIRWMHYCRNI